MLWLLDRDEAGFDGFEFPGPRRASGYDRWLERTPCDIRQLTSVPHDSPEPVRISIIDELQVLYGVSDDLRREFAARRDAYERMFRGLVHDAIHEGTFGDVDEKFATLLILSSVNWIYQWYRADGPMEPEEIARRITDLLFNGLKRTGS